MTELSNMAARLDQAQAIILKQEMQMDKYASMTLLAAEVFADNKAKGFWDDAVVVDEHGPHGFNPHLRNTGELLMLMVSELGEAIEAHRKGLNDDKLTALPGVHVELADCLIRILDYCGAHGVDIGDIVRQKLEYNRTRAYKHGKKY